MSCILRTIAASGFPAIGFAAIGFAAASGFVAAAGAATTGALEEQRGEGCTPRNPSTLPTSTLDK